MKFSKKINVISKDQAAFWLDRYGRWHNEHGPFEHKKIIAYFDKSIERDEDGYYLFQKTEYGAEKVYFPYEDCALFAVGVKLDDPIRIILNTGRQMELMPRHLYTQKNNLYMKVGEDRIKFIDHGLMKIADMMCFEYDQYYIKINGKKYNIPKDTST